MDKTTEGINAAWEEVEGAHRDRDKAPEKSPEEKWKELKKQFYGSDTVVIVDGGVIDFGPESVKDIANIGKTTYDEYLEIAHASLGHQRSSFEECFYNGAYGSFKGRISVKRGARCLFEKIWAEGDYGDGTCFEGKEEHVWMGAKEFKRFKPGDNIRFEAEVYRYLRTGNGKSLDYALRNPYGIEKIGDYELPSDDDLLRQQIDGIICDVCMFHDHCYMGMCIANEEWRESMRKTLYDAAKRDGDGQR